MAPRWPKKSWPFLSFVGLGAPGRPRSAQRRPKTPQDPAKTPPRPSQDSPKTPQEAPRRPQRAPRAHRDASRCYKTPQDDSTTLPRRLQTPKEFPRGPELPKLVPRWRQHGSTPCWRHPTSYRTFQISYRTLQTAFRMLKHLTVGFTYQQYKTHNNQRLLRRVGGVFPMQGKGEG